MTRATLAATALLVTLAACSDRGGNGSSADDSTTVIAPEMPRNPHVLAIDVGLAVDSLGRVIGGTFERITAPDTIYVSVRTQYVAAGAPLVVRLTQGEREWQKVEFTAGTPDADGIGRATAMLPAGASLTAGSYQIEVLLDGNSQGIRDLTVAPL